MKVLEVTVLTTELTFKVVGKVKENDSISGAFIREVITYVNGISSFGDIGKTRATITVQGAVLKTLVNVLTGVYPMLWDLSLDSSASDLAPKCHPSDQRLNYGRF